ncbi:MAG: 30S ribosomal protein S12 methylthiotransferase RimO [Firmicutes bacterium]|nr:30S ribosomal protein S12 methylthiotransferase RimO [Bacillota bacterium]
MEPTKVGMVSLGCSKNLVDSEIMLGSLEGAGYFITASPEEADVIIINTCGFIEDAKEESIDTILEMAAYKETGRCHTLLVTGCLSQRYSMELMEAIPEIDGMLGTGELDRLPELLQDAVQKLRPMYVDLPGFIYEKELPRVLTTVGHSAYLKIAEGCDHRCAYCVIPALRGPFKSRTQASIVNEAKKLADQGVKELILVAQDTSAYGKDLPKAPQLPQLLWELGKIPNIHWLRVLYTYPTTFSPELVQAFAENPKICRYVDLPLQHAANDVLKRMGRGPVEMVQRQLIENLRDAMPDIALRSTFIVGYPGETQADFEKLLAFLAEIQFDHVGIFPYSQEEGTPAAALPDQIPEDIKLKRYEQAMALQKEISRSKNSSRIGETYEVVIDGPSEETDLVLVARSQYQAPDVDGNIYIGNRHLPAGTFAKVRIKEAYDYDLVGEIVE